MENREEKEITRDSTLDVNMRDPTLFIHPLKYVMLSLRFSVDLEPHTAAGDAVGAH